MSPPELIGDITATIATERPNGLSCTITEVIVTSHANLSVKGSVALIGTWIGLNPGDAPGQEYTSENFDDRPSADFGPLAPGRSLTVTFRGCAKVPPPTNGAQYHLAKPEYGYTQV